MSGLARKCPLDPDRGRGALVTITGPRNVNILNQDHTGSDTGQESRVHFLKNATGRQVRRFPFYDQLMVPLLTVTVGLMKLTSHVTKYK